MPRILVVDDEQYMCEVCARTLQRSNYHVVTTNDSQAAIRLLDSERFDLLLTDITMPGISGLELVYAAHERDPTIAVIIMTGFASKENLQQAVRHGIADFLAKPFELEQLQLTVDQALHKRSLLQDNVRLHALEQLLADSQALTNTLDLATIGNTLLQVAMAQSGCRAGFVLVEQAHASTMHAPEQSELLKAGYALAEQATAQHVSLVGSNEAFCLLPDETLHAALAVPLYAQGEVSGVLVLCDDQPTVQRAKSQREIALLANHAGAALQNAVLYSQLNDAYTRLQDHERLKSEFIAVASHELRTPLSIVLGYSLMLRNQATTDHVRDYLQRVLENAQRIRGIVDDMVSLRHLDTGEAPPSSDSVVLQQVVQQACEQMLPICQEHHQELVITLPPSLITFITDREKVLLILGHLISNAVRFTPDYGMITLRGSVVSHAPDTNDDGQCWVVVEVHDTGIGIPEREQSRIFERFYQVSDSLTREHGGLGLGLAIVRELTAALGGKIWVSSQEGQGSTFTLALPHVGAF